MFVWDVLLSVWGLFQAVVPFFILLGVLVFIHEWGHFAVARFFKVRVEVFSLGFGKKLLKWKKGATTYTVSAIPLGGYVKMFGDQYGQTQIAEKDRADAFLYKKLYQRVLIVLAGPVMNFILAGVIFAGLFMVGEERAHPVISKVEKNSPAARAGFEARDTILAVDNHPIESLREWKQIILNRPSEVLSVKVRSQNSNIIKTLTVQPENNQVVGEFGFQETGGEVKGLSYSTASSVVGVSHPSSPAGQAGFQTFDRIVSLNGQPVFTWDEVKTLLASPGVRRHFFTINRQGHIKELVLDIKSPGPLKDMGFEKPDLFIADLKAGGAAFEAGLKSGDRIVKINGHSLNKWSDLVGQVQGFDPEKDQTLMLEVVRNGELKTLTVTPSEQVQLINGQEQKKYMLGIISGVKLVPAGGIFVSRQLNPFKALGQGFYRAGRWCGVTGVYIKKLIQGDISKKALGGAIHIGREAYKTYSYGIQYFFVIMAILSIQLFLVNLLPIPILDGGHLLFYAVEFVKGSPMSMEKMMVFQYMGLIVILSLLIFTTFNDVHNWIYLW